MCSAYNRVADSARAAQQCTQKTLLVLIYRWCLTSANYGILREKREEKSVCLSVFLSVSLCLRLRLGLALSLRQSYKQKEASSQ